MTYQRNMAGTAPFVSVIIPAYNAAEIIDGALNAVLKQTYPSKIHGMPEWWQLLRSLNLIPDNS